MKTVMTVLAFLVSTSAVLAQDVLDFRKLVWSTPRIRCVRMIDMYNSDGEFVEEQRQSAFGSGVVFSDNDDHFFVLTNSHVISGAINDTVMLDFYDQGERYCSVPGKVEFERFDASQPLDYAIIAIERNAFADIGKEDPPVIPLAPYDFELSQDAQIYSIGYPRSVGPFMFDGLVRGAQEDFFHFRPQPFSGQSGSPIFADFQDDEGNWITKIVGVVDKTTHVSGADVRNGNDLGRGVGLTLKPLYEQLGITDESN